MPNTIDVKDAAGVTRTINTNDYLATLTGEVQASPTANTVLARLKALADLAAASRANSSAYAASLTVKASSGKLLSLFGYNSGAQQFIQIHDAASLPANGVAPVAFFKVPGSSNFSFVVPVDAGLPCSNGIVVCNSSTGPTKTIGSADVYFTAVYI